MKTILVIIATIAIVATASWAGNLLLLGVGSSGAGGPVTFEAYNVWNGTAFEAYNVYNGTTFEAYSVRTP